MNDKITNINDKRTLFFSEYEELKVHIEKLKIEQERQHNGPSLSSLLKQWLKWK